MTPNEFWEIAKKRPWIARLVTSLYDAFHIHSLLTDPKDKYHPEWIATELRIDIEPIQKIEFFPLAELDMKQSAVQSESSIPKDNEYDHVLLKESACSVFFHYDGEHSFLREQRLLSHDEFGTVGDVIDGITTGAPPGRPFPPLLLEEGKVPHIDGVVCAFHIDETTSKRPGKFNLLEEIFRDRGPEFTSSVYRVYLSPEHL